MDRGIQITTLLEAEKRYNMKDVYQRVIDHSQQILELGYETYRSAEDNFPLTEQRRIFFEERVTFNQYLLSEDVTVMDRIIALLKHMAWKTTLIDFKLINNDTDVIISYQIKDEAIW